MYFADEEQAIRSYFYTQWKLRSDVPIAFENVAFDPATDAPGGEWVALYILPGEGNFLGISDDDLRFVGVVQVSITCMGHKGVQRVRELADMAAESLLNAQMSHGSSGLIRVRVPSIGNTRVSENNVRVDVSAPYWRDARVA